MKTYSAVATASTRVRVEYTCCHCGKENVDDNQYITAKGQSHGSLNYSPRMANEARQKVAEKASSIAGDVARGDYRSAYLTCTCPSCGKRQPWASYVRLPAWAIGLACFGAATILYMVAKWNEITPGPGIAVVLAMPVPLIAFAVKNLLASRKVAKLDPKYLPRIQRM